MRLRCLTPFLATLALAAQEEPMPYLATMEGVSHGWALTLGARLMDYPGYLGSDRQRVALLPYFSAEYDRRFYLGSSQVGPGFGGGMHLVREGGFTWDLGAGVGDSRPESRSPLLAGMGDRRANLFLGTGVHYRYDGFHAGFTVSQALRDDGGDRATLTLSKTLPLAPLWHLTLGVHGTWADAKAMAYDFGITPEQATNRAALVAGGYTGFTAAEAGPFTAQAGVRDAGARLTVSYQPKPGWVWTVGVNAGVLLGGVRDSPLVGRTTSLGAGAGFAYRF